MIDTDKIARKIAGEHVAHLLDDHGIVKKLYDVVKPELQEVARLFKNRDYDGLRALAIKLNGKSTTVKIDELDVKMPSSLRKAITGSICIFTFQNNPFRRWWAESGYMEGTITIGYNLGIPLMLIEDKIADKEGDKMLYDIGKAEMSIRHEVTHLLRDVTTGRIRTFIERMKKDEAVRENYRTHGHEELDFEIDAIVNAISLFAKRNRKTYNTMSIKELERAMPGLKFPPMGTIFWKQWMARLSREGLVTDAMKREFGVSGAK